MVPVVCWRSPSPARAVGEGARAWSWVPAAKPGKAQRPTLSGKSGGCWHHVMQSQTAAANRGKRAKNTPAGSRPGGGQWGRGADYAHEVDFDWGAEVPEPLSGAAGLAARTLGRQTGRKPPGFLRHRSPALLPLARPVRGSPARRARPSAYVTGGHAGAPARGKLGGGGGQGSGGRRGGGGKRGEVSDCLRVRRGGGTRWKLQPPP